MYEGWKPFPMSQTITGLHVTRRHPKVNTKRQPPAVYSPCAPFPLKDAHLLPAYTVTSVTKTKGFKVEQQQRDKKEKKKNSPLFAARKHSIIGHVHVGESGFTKSHRTTSPFSEVTRETP